jgi:peptidoglycan/LPS O-acetylase OafA/YrhL
MVRYKVNKSTPSNPTALAPTRERVEYIDGLRAVAALLVVVLHTIQMRGYDLHAAITLPADLVPSDSGLGQLIWLVYETLGVAGLWAVKVFIVISGYTLMMSAAKSVDGQPKGGLRGYFQRRIRRIWPPYYAALALSLAIIFFLPGMNVEFGGYHDQTIPVTPAGVLTHLTFTHTFDPSVSSQINTPLWTIAVEEQIYILFPFLLLPLWRRFHTLSMIAGAALVPLVVWLVLPYANFLETRAWFMVLFAMGAVGASINFSRRAQDQRWRERLPWLLIAAGSMVIWAVLKFVLPRLLGANTPAGYITDPVTDPFFGVAIAALLVRWTELWRRGVPKFSVLAVLDSRPLVFLGVFSYSLYLMHAPFLSVLTQAFRSLGINGDMFFVLMLVVGMPLVVIATYGFHLIFEKPFMPAAAKQSRRVHPSLASAGTD